MSNAFTVNDSHEFRVNEIFYSLQGEGHYTGTPAVFLRLAGCNLRCWFCDTDFESFTEMTANEILEKIQPWPTRYIVITGGEPTLQINAELTDALHRAGYYIMMETNGTRQLPLGCDIDWITCSPKLKAKGSNDIVPVRLTHIDELKVVFEGTASNQDLSAYDAIPADEYRLQPCATGNPADDQRIVKETIDYILNHPKWSLSFQTHKKLNIQ